MKFDPFRGIIRYETLRVSDLMSLRRVDAVTQTGSREGHHLWPKVPLPRVPLGHIA